MFGTKTTTRLLERLRARREKLQAALDEMLASGVASASLGSAGNSQSYSRLSPDQYRAELARIDAQIARLLRGGGATRRTSPDFAKGGAYGEN
jgi:hypothetical protein